MARAWRRAALVLVAGALLQLMAAPEPLDDSEWPCAGDFFTSCDLALRAECPPGTPLCPVCAGRQQHALRVAGEPS